VVDGDWEGDNEVILMRSGKREVGTKDLLNTESYLNNILVSVFCCGEVRRRIL
jgi:hypothetical protein